MSDEKNREKEYLKNQAEMVFNSLVFWEREISKLTKELEIKESEGVSVVKGERILKYYLIKLNFDLREMGRLDKQCKIFIDQQNDQ